MRLNTAWSARPASGRLTRSPSFPGHWLGPTPRWRTITRHGGGVPSDRARDIPPRMPELLDRLSLEHPVVQAGMGGGIATAELAAAVSNAGGLGTVGILPD